MFNRPEVLTKAWADYSRDQRMGLGVRRDGPFSRKHFAYCLRMAWAVTKERAAKAAAVTETAVAFVAAERRVQSAAVAAMDPMVRSARLSTIRDELTTLDYAPWGVRTSQRRMDLNAELASLTA